MITNFEEITVDLTPVELEVLPLLIAELLQHKKDNPIKSPVLVNKMKVHIHFRQIPITKFTGVRFKKIRRGI
jgi:hypothetical protein